MPLPILSHAHMRLYHTFIVSLYPKGSPRDRRSLIGHVFSDLSNGNAQYFVPLTCLDALSALFSVFAPARVPFFFFFLFPFSLVFLFFTVASYPISLNICCCLFLLFSHLQKFNSMERLHVLPTPFNVPHYVQHIPSSSSRLFVNHPAMVLL